MELTASWKGNGVHITEDFKEMIKQLSIRNILYLVD